MKPLVIGVRDDVAGFALAGVDGIVCENAEEAARAFARADEHTLVIWASDALAPDPRQAKTPVVQLPRRS